MRTKLFTLGCLFTAILIATASLAQTRFILNKKGEATDKGFQQFVASHGYQLISAFDTACKKPLLVYALYIKNNKLGILDIAGREVTPALYDAIPGMDRDIFPGSSHRPRAYIVIANQKYGLIDQFGKQVLPTDNDKIYYTQGDSVLGVENDRKETTIDYTGNLVRLRRQQSSNRPYVPEYTTTLNADKSAYELADARNKKHFSIPNYGDVKWYYRNQVIYYDRTKRKYGLYDAAAQKMIIPMEYDNVEYHGNGIYVVKQGNLAGAIDSTGAIKYPIEAGAVDIFSGGILVYKDRKYAVYNAQFKKLAGFDYDSYTYLNQRFIGLVKNRKMGAIRSDGSILFDFKYDAFDYYATDMPTPIIVTKINGQLELWNLAGKKLFNANYDMILPECMVEPEIPSVSPGISFQSNQPNLFYFFSKNGKYGLLDNSFKPLLNNEYDLIMKSQSRDFIYVKLKGKWGVMNVRTKQMTIPAELDWPPRYRPHNYLEVLKDHKTALYDTDGTLIIPYEQRPMFFPDNIYKGLIKLDISLHQKRYYDYMGHQVDITE